MRIVWRGGDITSQKIPIPVGSFAELSGSQEMERIILDYSQKGKSDEAIAAHLTALGHRSPQSLKVLPSTVQTIRLKHGIFQVRHQSHPRRIPGYLTVPQIARVIDKNFPQPVEKVRLQDYCCDDSFSLTDYRPANSGDEIVVQAVRGICEVFNELGYGYLESVYLRALELELGVEPFFFDQDLEFDVFFESKRIGTQKIKSVLNDEIWIILTSTTKTRKGMENKIRSILKSTSLSCGILANLNGNRPQIKIIQQEKA